jgi:hypothetical protein
MLELEAPRAKPITALGLPLTTPMLSQRNSTLHIFRISCPPKPCELKHDLSDGSSTLMAVHNSAMLMAIMVKPEEVVIMSDDHALLATSKNELLFITCTKQANITWRRYVDATFAQSFGNGDPNAFVKVKSNLHQRPCLLWAEKLRWGGFP